MSVSTTDAVKAINHHEFFSSPKKKETDFNGDWLYAESDVTKEHYYRSAMISAKFQDNVLSFEYKTYEWQSDAAALADVRALQAKWISEGKTEIADLFNEEFARDDETLIDSLGATIEILRRGVIHAPKFFYFDENDREPLKGFDWMLKARPINYASIKGLSLRMLEDK